MLLCREIYEQTPIAPIFYLSSAKNINISAKIFFLTSEAFNRRAWRARQIIALSEIRTAYDITRSRVANGWSVGGFKSNYVFLSFTFTIFYAEGLGINPDVPLQLKNLLTAKMNDHSRSIGKMFYTKMLKIQQSEITENFPPPSIFPKSLNCRVNARKSHSSLMLLSQRFFSLRVAEYFRETIA